LKDAGVLTLTIFNLHHHTVKKMVTDDEVCLATLKRSLDPFRVIVKIEKSHPPD
jgi:hypothetical protein